MHCSCSKQGDVTITVIGAFYRCVPLIRSEVTQFKLARRAKLGLRSVLGADKGLLSSVDSSDHWGVRVIYLF